MALLSYSNREVNAKIVYYGPGLSGKTTNIDYIYKKMKPEQKGKLVSLATQTDRTLFFDFMPIDLGEVKGFKTRFHLYTVPGQVFYNATRKMVLKGTDGVVFVADSQRQMMDANIESLKNLEENLNVYGKTLERMPHVIQFNKRDLSNAVPLEEMYKKLNKYNAPFFEAVALEGKGVMETLSAVAKMVLRNLREKPEQIPSGVIAPEAGIEAAREAGFDLAVSHPPSSPDVEGELGTLQAGDAERITNNLYRIPLRFRLKDVEREFSINISIKVEELFPPKTEEPQLEAKKEDQKEKSGLGPLTNEEFEEGRLVEEWLKEEGAVKKPVEDDLTIEVEEEKEK
ncbi:MAG: mglA [Deltaproteobacteria bacterium]|nr:mglA [Deltaproteobacteria bacterium]